MKNSSKRWIKIYASDFSDSDWKEICNTCEVEHTQCDELVIRFTYKNALPYLDGERFEKARFPKERIGEMPSNETI